MCVAPAVEKAGVCAVTAVFALIEQAPAVCTLAKKIVLHGGSPLGPSSSRPVLTVYVTQALEAFTSTLTTSYLILSIPCLADRWGTAVDLTASFLHPHYTNKQTNKQKNKRKRIFNAKHMIVAAFATITQQESADCEIKGCSVIWAIIHFCCPWDLRKQLGTSETFYATARENGDRQRSANVLLLLLLLFVCFCCRCQNGDTFLWSGFMTLSALGKFSGCDAVS